MDFTKFKETRVFVFDGQSRKYTRSTMNYANQCSQAVETITVTENTQDKWTLTLNRSQNLRDIIQ